MVLVVFCFCEFYVYYCDACLHECTVAAWLVYLRQPKYMFSSALKFAC